MIQKYMIFKNNDPIALKNKYYKKSTEEAHVEVVVTTKRKYAFIEYNFNTLQNAEQYISDMTNCNISKKIKAYVSQYYSEHSLPASYRIRLLIDTRGCFYSLIEDAEMIGLDIYKIIEEILNSKCIHYISKHEYDRNYFDPSSYKK